MNLANKPPLGLKQERPGKNPKHLARIRDMPCVICTEYGMQQLTPTAAHHCIHGRGEFRKAPDCMAIPLCEGHHQGLFDTSKIALHQQPARWRAAYGDDTDWISWVEARL